MNQFKKMINRLIGSSFMLDELVKRDFKKKYKGTVLGMAWSVLSPLMSLLVMKVVFSRFFGRTTPHYTTYLFTGQLIFSFFSESTSEGLTSLYSNAPIFSKINVPKYLFLLSKNVQTLVNFGLILLVYFFFCLLDGITFTWKMLLLIYPIIFLLLFNIGIGLILASAAILFRDIKYLWTVFLQLLTYVSAVFYNVNSFPERVQKLFMLNPIYVFITYFRTIVIDMKVPSPAMHLIILADAIIALGIGFLIYHKNNMKFLYYV